MKKFKKIQLKLEKEVISSLNSDNLGEVKGGADETSKRTACFKPTVMSDCCTFASVALCYSKDMTGACASEANCNSQTASGGAICCAPDPIITGPSCDLGSGLCAVIETNKCMEEMMTINNCADTDACWKTI